jgi:catechol 2,3-dioxygenase-like lactoylglutathione lyase family enzyme
MNDVGLTHIALPVTDLDESADFYERYARMQIVHRRDGVLWLSDKTRPFVLVLIECPAVMDPLRPMAHLGVGCESRDEVDRLAARARTERCLISGPADAGPPVGYWAFLRDPDGHTLEVSFGQQVGLAVGARD